jgi:hypothetical protein
MLVIKDTETRIENGETHITSKETTVSREQEPDYIKIYTKMWCEFNAIPVNCRELFFQLAIRMTYCSSDDINRSQIVCVGKIFRDDIKRACGWATDNTFYDAMRTLCKCNAIHKIAPSYYQINPSYAGKGQWKYNPKTKQGGIKDLVAIFDFANGSVDTNIVFEHNEGSSIGEDDSNYDLTESD